MKQYQTIDFSFVHVWPSICLFLCWFRCSILVFLLIYITCKDVDLGLLFSKLKQKNPKPTNRSSRSQMFFKIGFLKNFVIFTGKHLLSLWKKSLKTCNFIKERDFITDVFCKYCVISKDSFLYRTPPEAASKQKYHQMCQSLMEQYFTQISSSHEIWFYLASQRLLIQRRIQNPVKHLDGAFYENS